MKHINGATRVAADDWRTAVCERDIADAERVLSAFDGERLPKVDWVETLTEGESRARLNYNITLSYIANLVVKNDIPYAAQRESILLHDWASLSGLVIPQLKERIADRQRYLTSG